MAAYKPPKPTKAPQVITDDVKNNLEVLINSFTGSAAQIEELAALGISTRNIARLCGMDETYIFDNPTRLAAYHRGRANVSSRIRSSIVTDALENNSLQAKLYLDKIMGGDVVQENINLTVQQQPLRDIPTEDLIEIAMKRNE